MPYCCQCGKPVTGTARFCTACGAPQPASAPHASDVFSGISDRNAALLCYIPWLGWIAAVIVIASRRYKRDTPEAREVRFHAFQGLYLFVAWLIVDWVISPVLRFEGMGMGHAFSPLGGLLRLAMLAAWIVMLVKVSRSEHYRLPIIGEMAERSVHEQRV
jgi:uncharacterized membrane protein